METLLRRWWTEKYKLPWTHSCFQKLTPFELLVEFYEDKYSEDQLEAYKTEDGEYFLGDSGDPLIDKWEQEIAMGLDPDLTEGMSQDDKLKLAQEEAKFRKVRDSKGFEEINEDFSAYPMYEPITGAYAPDKIVKNRKTLSNKDFLGNG